MSNNGEQRVKMTMKEMMEIGAVLVAIALGWGVVTTKVNALEERIKEVPRMQTDIEVVKSAIIDIKDMLREIRRNGRQQH